MTSQGSPDHGLHPSASMELGPVRTGRDRGTEGARPSSTMSVNSQSTIDTDIDVRTKDPLPPIGSEQVPGHTKVNSAKMRSSMAASSSEQRQKSTSSTSSRRPRIVNAYRRETGDDDFSDDNVNNTPKGNKTKQKREKSSKGMKKEVKVVYDSSGEERTVVSIECQTEWSWLDDMKKSSFHNFGHSSSRAALKTPTTSTSESDLEREDDLLESQIPGQDSARTLTPRHSDRKPSHTATGSRHMNSALTNKESYTSEPFPSRADEYGIPILNLSSESDDSSDEDSVYQYKEETAEQQDPDAGTLPSIGPPQILQYQRESTQKEIEVEEPEQRQTVVTEEELEKYKSHFTAGGNQGIFEGQCDFCHAPIKAFPSLDDQTSRDPQEIFCCNEYREFVQFMVTQPVQEEPSPDKIIDVKPHEPFGSKQARKAAKERAAIRMRERETARQQAAMDAARNTGRDGGGGAGGGAGAGFYQFARQMKTINYQLSSQKCLEEGWTLRPPSPLTDHLNDQDIFEVEPVLPPWAEAEGKRNARGLIRKFYEDGKPFVVLFPDGTGTVYYPSGRPAITISAVEQGLYSYVAHDDNWDDCQMIAVFDPSGYGTTYYQDGTIRLHLDQIGGLELDPRGARRRKWSWKDQTDHVHAPPIQPITFAITSNLSVRVVSQEHITITFSCRTRSCRFQVGSRLKLVAPQNLPPSEFDEDDVYRKEVRNKIESIMDRVSNLLKFPKCPRLDKLPTPSHLSSRNQKVQQMKGAIAKSKAAKKDKGQTVITVN